MIPSPCNLLVGMATGGTIRSETLVSLIGALEVVKSHGIGIDLSVQIGGYVTRNRNELITQAQQRKADYILFVDNDMVFPTSAIQRLIDADKDIIGVNYNARGIPDKPVVSTVKLIDPETDPRKGEIISQSIPAQMFKCYGLGTGFMLIRLHVFEKLKKPYFIAWEDESGEFHTEDIEFCKRAGNAGFEIWCNPTIKMKHIGVQEY